MDSLSFISDICGALKNLKRTGWVKHKIPLPESDADHMHRCAMCALLLSQPADPRDNYDDDDKAKYLPSNVDTTKLLRMAVTHDLCEALAGDITPFCDPTLVESKHDKENQAMLAIQKVVGDPLGQELYNLWKEYEDQETVEAMYCKDIGAFLLPDMMELCVFLVLDSPILCHLLFCLIFLTSLVLPPNHNITCHSYRQI